MVDVERLFMSGLMLLVGLVLFVFFLRRLLAWMDQRGWIQYSGDPPTYGSLGSAFLELQSIAQPEKQYILQEKRAEKIAQEDQSGPDDPAAHLRLKLPRRRIRSKKRFQVKSRGSRP